MVIDGEADLTLGMYTITYLRSKFMTSSETYFSVPFIIIVPPGDTFSPFEKLFRPFQAEVWAALLTTFIVAAAVVTIIKLQRTSIREFVFGKGNRSPYMNILSVFLGVSMPQIPGRNFARSLLMMFILFSIVKRTLYQGILFQVNFIGMFDKKGDFTRFLKNSVFLKLFWQFINFSTEVHSVGVLKNK